MFIRLATGLPPGYVTLSVKLVSYDHQKMIVRISRALVQSRKMIWLRKREREREREREEGSE